MLQIMYFFFTWSDIHIRVLTKLKFVLENLTFVGGKMFLTKEGNSN